MALNARYQARLLDPILLVFILRHILLQPVVPFHSLELGPADAELLTIVPTLHRSLQIHVVVLNNSEDDIGRRDALCSLRCHKFTSFLDLCVDIFGASTSVRGIVMGDIVDVIRLKEVECDDPRAWANDLIDPFAVLQDIAPLLLSHDNLTLFLNGLLVTTHPNNKVHVREEFLGLL